MPQASLNFAVAPTVLAMTPPPHSRSDLRFSSHCLLPLMVAMFHVLGNNLQSQMLIVFGDGAFGR